MNRFLFKCLLNGAEEHNTFSFFFFLFFGNLTYGSVGLFGIMHELRALVALRYAFSSRTAHLNHRNKHKGVFYVSFIAFLLFSVQTEEPQKK